MKISFLTLLVFNSVSGLKLVEVFGANSSFKNEAFPTCTGNLLPAAVGNDHWQCDSLSGEKGAEAEEKCAKSYDTDGGSTPRYHQCMVQPRSEIKFNCLAAKPCKAPVAQAPKDRLFAHEGLLSYDDSGIKKWGTVGDLGLMTKPFTGMAWWRVRRRIEWHHPIISIGTSDVGNKNEGIGFRAGHGLYISLGGRECHGGNWNAAQGTWLHLAYSYDPTTKEVKMYRDGALAKTCSHTHKMTADWYVVSSAKRSWGDLYDIYLYNRIMDLDEIKTLMGSEPTVEWWVGCSWVKATKTLWDGWTQKSAAVPWHHERFMSTCDMFFSVSMQEWYDFGFGNNLDMCNPISWCSIFPHFT